MSFEDLCCLWHDILPGVKYMFQISLIFDFEFSNFKWLDKLAVGTWEEETWVRISESIAQWWSEASLSLMVQQKLLFLLGIEHSVRNKNNVMKAQHSGTEDIVVGMLEPILIFLLILICHISISIDTMCQYLYWCKY